MFIIVKRGVTKMARKFKGWKLLGITIIQTLGHKTLEIIVTKSKNRLKNEKINAKQIR